MTNVLLVTDWNDVFKFSEVTRELRSLGVRARIAHDVEPKMKHQLWTLGKPTKVISMFPLERFLPTWAEIWQQKNYTKIDEYEILERSGIPVPKWVSVHEGKEPDLSGFSEYVVVKPALGWRGAFVRIMRKDKVNYRPIATEVMGGIVSPALIAQEYIHTGTWPISYRVCTVFGKPIFKFRTIADNNHPPLVGSNFDAQFFAGRTIVSTAKGCIRDEEVPEEVVDLARRAHQAAFPDIPLLGFDIIRDLRTQQLYVLEVNAFGRTYLLSDHDSKRHTREFGFDLHQQFGGVKAVVRGIYQRLLKGKDKKNLIEERNSLTCAAS